MKVEIFGCLVRKEGLILVQKWGLMDCRYLWHRYSIELKMGVGGFLTPLILG